MEMDRHRVDSLLAVSPGKRHRSVNSEHEHATVDAEGSPKHRRVVVDECIGDAIAAKAAVDFTDEQLARIFEREL